LRILNNRIIFLTVVLCGFLGLALLVVRQVPDVLKSQALVSSATQMAPIALVSAAFFTESSPAPPNATITVKPAVSPTLLSTTATEVPTVTPAPAGLPAIPTVLPAPAATPARARISTVVAPQMPTATPTPSTPIDSQLGDLLQHINDGRKSEGMAPLAWSTQLAVAALVHSSDMAANNFFSHTGSNGTEVNARMVRAGYAPLYWGEVLTWVGGGPGAAFAQFWDSPHHHDILLGGDFSDLGAARVADPRGSFDYWTVVLGRRR
jgi:uncharacterized protein YkwD